MKIKKTDHTGINVIDLEAAKEFFLEMGLEVMGQQMVEGEWVGRIIGLKDVKDEIIMMRTPGGEAMIELVKFYNPVDEKGLQPIQSNTLGISHICFAVEDVEGLVAKLQKKGGELMGEIHNYKDVYKICYLRGPEGIILELAEKLN
ncbi:MAG: VOC family protein [Bacteroidetes bacterium]|nr:VOC family protein [Bacteroidota bacterium]